MKKYALLLGFAGAVAMTGAAQADTVVVGEEVQCLRSQDIRQTTPVSNETIAVKLRNKKFARIDMRNRCSGLKIDGGFSYSTSINKLCKQDVLTVIRSGTPCSMERIVGIDEEEYDALIASK